MAKRMKLNVKLESMGPPEGFGEKLTLCIGDMCPELLSCNYYSGHPGLHKCEKTKHRVTSVRFHAEAGHFYTGFQLGHARM